jgi:hypothetical protein
MRRALPAVLALAVLAVAAGLVVGGGDRAAPPPARSGWTPVLVPRPAPSTVEPRRIADPDQVPQARLLPPATAPARVYPL